MCLGSGLGTGSDGWMIAAGMGGVGPGGGWLRQNAVIGRDRVYGGAGVVGDRLSPGEGVGGGGDKALEQASWVGAIAAASAIVVGVVRWVWLWHADRPLGPPVLRDHRVLSSFKVQERLVAILEDRLGLDGRQGVRLRMAGEFALSAWRCGARNWAAARLRRGSPGHNGLAFLVQRIEEAFAAIPASLALDLPGPPQSRAAAQLTFPRHRRGPYGFVINVLSRRL